VVLTAVRLTHDCMRLALGSVHPAAGNQVFVAAGGEDLFDRRVTKRTEVAMNKPVRLFSVRAGML
jgi:hypothetical protein